MRVVVDARYLSERFGSMTVFCGNLLHALTGIDLGERPVALIPRGLHSSAYPIRDELGSRVEWVQSETDPFAHGQSLTAELRWIHRDVPSLLARRVTDADVLVVTYHHPPFRTPGVRRIAIVHDLCGLGVGFPRNKKAYWRHYLRLRAAAHFADEIWPISRATEQAMLQRFPSSQRRMGPVVHNGIRRQAAPQQMVAETLAAHHLASESYVVAFATRQARKNFAASLAALSELRRRGQALRLVGIAPRNEADAMRGWCAAEGHHDAVILDSVSDAELDALYAGALALLWPSVCEGFGYPVVEAMAQGCPPLVWSFGPGTELIGDVLDPMPSLSAMSIADRLQALRELTRSDRAELREALASRARSFAAAAYRSRVRDALTLSMPVAGPTP